MTKTRDQRCRSVIQRFFELPTNLDKTYYEFSKKNESGWKTARYQINIPNKWESKQPHYDDTADRLYWNTIEHIQEIPPKEKIDEIIQLFKETFEPYENSVELRSGRKRVTSYLRIYQSDIEENNYNIRIMVLYNRQEIPFLETEPDSKMLLEKLERENHSLKNTMNLHFNETDKAINRLRRIIRRTSEERDLAKDLLDASYQSFQLSNVKYMRSYRDIINELYKETNKAFDCPVCYETIKSDEVFTTPCNHVICNGCAKHCKNSCPMCRQDMCCVEDDIPPLEDDVMPLLDPILDWANV